MKKFALLVILLCFSLSLSTLRAQSPADALVVKSMEGKLRPFRDYVDPQEGHFTLFVFWKTCCPTNLNMIDSLLELTDEHQGEEKLTVVLISVDDPRSSQRVMPVVRMKGWKSDVILDVNMELARALHVHIPPQWVAVDHTGMPVFRRKIMEGEADSEFYFDELLSAIRQ